MTRCVSCLAVVCCLAPAPVRAQAPETPIAVAAAETGLPPLVIAASDQRPLYPPQPLRDAASKRPAALLPMYVSFGALQGLDYVSTTRALSNGTGREANPVMKPVVGNRAAFLAVKAGATAGTIWLSEKMRRKHPVRAVVFMVATNIAMATIVAHNFSVR
jgi:hypothetical protein